MKQFAVIEAVIYHDIDDASAEIRSICTANSLEEGKEKANEMFEEYVAEQLSVDASEKEIEEEMKFYKSEKCHFDYHIEDDYYEFFFIDIKLNFPQKRQYIVTLINK